MLLLTQTAAGMLALAGIGAFFPAVSTPASNSFLTLSAWGALHAGLIVSAFHLGRPLKAWRSFLGWRRSWMSKEIIAFSILSLAATILLAATFLAPQARGLPAVAMSTAMLGFLAVFCSAMIYVDTRRPFWSASRTFTQFFGTVALLGAGTGAVICPRFGGETIPALANHAVLWVLSPLVLQTTLLGCEAWRLVHSLSNPADPAHRSSMILYRRLGWVIGLRLALWFAMVLLALPSLNRGESHAALAMAALLLLFVSQLLERYGFFTAASAPRMPGGSPA
jgi:DMSO reductase anchor subunit